MTRIAVIGDALLDRDLEGRVERLCPEAPVPVVEDLTARTRPGGAGLAAALAAADGHDVTLVTALARDDGGRELESLLAAAGVNVVDLGLVGATPVKERVRCDSTLLLRLDHGGRHSTVGPVTDAARRALRSADTVLVSDYGRGLAETARTAVQDLASVVWDPHPRGPAPVPGVRLATPNDAESRVFAGGHDGAGLRATADRARRLVRRWAADAVAVTLGANGAVLSTGDAPPQVIPAPPVVGGDTCGAGDRFASAAAAALAVGSTVTEAVAAAVAESSAFVASGGAGSFGVEPLELETEATDLAPRLARLRAGAGTLVATGGCFDLLHAGHVATLQAARALGDRLVVCLNSDESVRRLKGPGRPLVPEHDRVAVLESLACVDAVVVFEEDTPVSVLERLRPDVWAKGGDYDAAELPETEAVESWGGQVVILPYVDGRSTTRLLEEAALRGN